MDYDDTPRQKTTCVSANTPDADFVVMIVDAHPNGFFHLLSAGILCASTRESLVDHEPLAPGKVCRVTVDIGHWAATIRPGHPLSVQIQGSHFPVYDRNLNTGEGPFRARMRVATPTIVHDEERPSRVVLPVLPLRQ